MALTTRTAYQTVTEPRQSGPLSLRLRLIQHLKLRHLLFLLLLFSGIIPLSILSWRLINDYRQILKDQETVLLTSAAQALADKLSEDLARRHEQLRQLGEGILAQPGYESLEERFVEPWVEAHLRRFLEYNPEIIGLHLLNSSGRGPRLNKRDVNERVQDEIFDTFKETRRTGLGVYRFVVLSEAQDPGVVISVPVSQLDDQATEGGDSLVVQALVTVEVSLGISSDPNSAEEVFLVDKNGAFLWSGGTWPETPQIELALRESDLIPDFARRISVTREYDLEVNGRQVPTLARVVPVAETGWRVVVHKPAAQAFSVVQQAVAKVVIASLVLLGLALAFALLAARWLSQPIQRLADTSHEIAAGNFDRRVDTHGLGFEIADFARDFNRMSDYVANYVEQLRRAAQANRELFISAIRAFAAAIDAKDPYTRGHSERVAAYSRAIARYVGVPVDVQERVWVSAVLHDIGKIGVDDDVLKKGGVLTQEERSKMEEHPVIGAEIVAPIADLEAMIPGIRWHHEAWNGNGYPDGLAREQIPLIARIIGVADTYDAMTTNRPYQQAFSSTYALETIEKLAGTKFDPKIVTAFLLAFRAGHIEHARSLAENVTTSVSPMAASFETP